MAVPRPRVCRTPMYRERSNNILIGKNCTVQSINDLPPRMHFMYEIFYFLINHNGIFANLLLLFIFTAFKRHECLHHHYLPTPSYGFSKVISNCVIHSCTVGVVCPNTELCRHTCSVFD